MLRLLTITIIGKNNLASYINFNFIEANSTHNDQVNHQHCNLTVVFTVISTGQLRYAIVIPGLYSSNPIT